MNIIHIDDPLRPDDRPDNSLSSFFEKIISSNPDVEPILILGREYADDPKGE